MMLTAVQGDFDGNGVADLAVGVPYEDLSYDDVGAVNVIYGERGTGLNTSHNQLLRGDGMYLKFDGTKNVALYFGAALAVGDFDRDGYADLVVGAPEERFHLPGYDLFDYDGWLTCPASDGTGIFLRGR